MNYNISIINPNCVCSVFPVSFQMLTRESARGRVPLCAEYVPRFLVTGVWVGIRASKLVTKEVGWWVPLPSWLVERVLGKLRNSRHNEPTMWAVLLWIKKFFLNGSYTVFGKIDYLLLKSESTLVNFPPFKWAFCNFTTFWLHFKCQNMSFKCVLLNKAVI